jgi:membrane-bound ClpP family serine protease
MARIRVTRRDNAYCVSLRGRLSARDLGRLERACGRALEQPRAPLTLELDEAGGMDDAARRFLHRLVERGALISHRR